MYCFFMHCVGLIGYIENFSNTTNKTQNPVYINDSIDQGIIIRTPDECLKVSCLSDGLIISDNQCTTPIPPSTTNCTVREYQKVQLKIENNRCISRNTIAQQRCGGSCIDDDDEECECCSVGTIALQPITFDCFTDNTKTNKEERIIQIPRIQTCQCHVCKNSKR